MYIKRHVSLKEVELWLKRGQLVRFLRETCPRKNRQLLGSLFKRGVSPSKMGHIAPFLATIQHLSKTRAFLLEKRSEGCFVWAAPSLSLARTYLIIALKMWYVSWELNPARVKASGRGAKFYPRRCYFSVNT
jgi:hypothetical protein